MSESAEQYNIDDRPARERMISSHSPRGRLLWVAVAVLFALPAFAVDLTKKVDFNIPPQSLSAALIAFSHQAKIQVIVSEDLGQQASQGIIGQHSIGDALGQLLNATGLNYHVVSDTSITIGKSSKVPLSRSDDHRQGGDSNVPLPGTTGDESSKYPSPKSSEAASTEGNSDKTKLEEIVVTGTNIRGSESAGSKVIVISHDDIEKSGYATIQGVMQTLPQNFGGGATELNASDNRANNYNNGTAVNLRGLGVDSTLVLVNGRRQPAGGVSAAFVDISSIATSAIDRIEILPEGASAIYGSDAVGGVVNIILRKDFQGAETSARFGQSAGSQANETTVSQLFGTNWSSGNVIAGYQYWERQPLRLYSRAYTADNGDQRAFGGDDFRQITASPGTILDANYAPAYAIPRGQNGVGLTVGQLTPGANYQDFGGNGRASLNPEQNMHSGFFSATQNFSDQIELFAEGRYSIRRTAQTEQGAVDYLSVPSSNPFYVNPFGGTGPVNVAYDYLNDLGPLIAKGSTETYTATLGASTLLGHAWKLTVDGSFGHEKTVSILSNQINFNNYGNVIAALADSNPATALNVFGNGGNNNAATLNSIRGGEFEQGVSRVSDFNLTADGPLMDLPAGSVKLAVGADYRIEHIHEGANLPANTPLQTLFPFTQGRNVSAAFGELAIPVVSRAQAIPGVGELSLSLAGRYEHYSDFGSTFRPRVGLNWSPAEALKFRGSWGTSFKAPRLEDIESTASSGFSDVVLAYPDPQSATGQSNFLRLVGTNPTLKPETARVWTAGADLTSAVIPHAQISLTYFNIDYKNKISPGGDDIFDPLHGVLSNPIEWASLINRNPTASQISAICNSSNFFGNAAACLSTPIAGIVDLRLRNLASLKVQGLDFNADDTVKTAVGDFRAAIGGTYTFNYDRAVTNTASETSVLDTVQNPLSLRLRGQLAWMFKGWSAGTFVNYAGSYKDPSVTPARPVSSWTTVDANLGYRTARGSSLVDNLALTLTAINLFNRQPPFVNTRLGFDTANANLFDRTLSIQLSKTW